MTSGTLDFLTKICEKHPRLSFYFMHDQDTTHAYYEDTVKTVFATAREFEIIVATGKLQEDGFVVMNNIPVTDEGKPIFESQFKQRAGMINDTPGFYALRVLRPFHGNTYIVMVQWDNQESYEKWKNSEAFAKSHKKPKDAKAKPPYAAGPSYVTTYQMVDFEEEE